MTVVVQSICFSSLYTTQWYTGSAGCPNVIGITFFSTNPTYADAISFAGRPLVGTNCLSSETYVTYDVASRTFSVDIWKAYKAGVWTSSTTIVGYSQNAAPTVFDGSQDSIRFLQSNFTSSAITGICPTVAKVTYTITDTGVVSSIP